MSGISKNKQRGGEEQQGGTSNGLKISGKKGD